MIIRRENERYDGSHRVLMYETDEEGRLVERQRKSDLDDQISTFYEQRTLELARLRRQLLDGAISPIALCMAYQNLTVADLASRVKLSKRQVKRHLTPAGFGEVTVAVLQRYARVFDLAVADLFQFVDVGEGVEVRDEHRRERLIQLVTVALAGEGDDEAD